MGLRIVYKLRNAPSDTHKERPVLSWALLLELTVSGCSYALRHSLYESLDGDQMLVLYFLRCQLTVTLSLALVFGPKVSFRGQTADCRPNVRLLATVSWSAGLDWLAS